MSDHDCANTQLYPVEQCHICQEREHYKFIESENTRLRAQLAEAREVIEFYGAEKTYIIPAGSGDVADWLTATCPAQDDIGTKARAFLVKYPKGDK